MRCEKCGQADYVLIDGYWFGDTLLEGVMFRVSKRGGRWVAVVDPKDADYLADIGPAKWTREAKEYANSKALDVAYCPKCGGDIYELS